ncbi:MAG: hypothetical protein K2W96_08335 [Gemmataceae bacterium]|nr:hypothetical protein [Gemmataceae bacterium]
MSALAVLAACLFPAPPVNGLGHPARLLPNPARVLARTSPRSLALFRAEGGELLRRFDDLSNPAVSPKGTWLAATQGDSLVLHRLEEDEEAWKWEPEFARASHLAFSWDESRLLACCGSVALVIEVKTKKVLQRVPVAGESGWRSGCLDPAGKRAALIDSDKRLWIADAATGNLQPVAHQAERTPCFSCDGKHLVFIRRIEDADGAGPRIAVKAGDGPPMLVRESEVADPVTLWPATDGSVLVRGTRPRIIENGGPAPDIRSFSVGARLDPTTRGIKQLWEADDSPDAPSEPGRDFDPENGLRVTTDSRFVSRVINYRIGEVKERLDPPEEEAVRRAPPGRMPRDLDDRDDFGLGPGGFSALSSPVCFGFSLVVLLVAGYVSYRIGRGL